MSIYDAVYSFNQSSSFDTSGGAPFASGRPAAVDSAAASMALLREAPRVLHIDADGDAALVLATLLVPETRVTHVHTLAAAERAIQTEHFALVVLDPDLPDGDGASLIACLRQTHAHTPVLLYSARHPESREQANAFLPKPWTSPRQLWRTVSQMLGLGPVLHADVPA